MMVDMRLTSRSKPGPEPGPSVGDDLDTGVTGLLRYRRLVIRVLLLLFLLLPTVTLLTSRALTGRDIFLILAAFLFACGIFCLATKRNAVGILMGVELILNAANVNFVAFARYNPAFRLEGQVFALLVVVLAAAEAAVALAIILNFYNNHATVDVDKADELRG